MSTRVSFAAGVFLALLSGASMAEERAVKSDVNMRERAENGAPTVAIIPRGAVVQVGACSYWCPVAFNGYNGFIYSGFIAGSGQVVESAPSMAPNAGRSRADPGPPVVIYFDPNQ